MRCRQIEKNQATVAVANDIESKCDLSPEATVDNGENADHIAAVAHHMKECSTTCGDQAQLEAKYYRAG